MKGLLLDENLPASLHLPTTLPILHATEISRSPSDSVVWQRAQEGMLVIVTKDADFGHRICPVSLLLGLCTSVWEISVFDRLSTV